MSPPGVGSDSEEGGDLFASDSSCGEEEIAAESATKPSPEIQAELAHATSARGPSPGVFELLEAACEAPRHSKTLRLGSLLASARLQRPALESCQEENSVDGDHELATASTSRDMAARWRLQLELQSTQLDDSGLFAEDICEKIVELNVGLHAITSRVNGGASASISIQASSSTGEPQSLLMGILAVLVDLPISHDPVDGRPVKKARSAVEAATLPELELVVEKLANEIESLLDDLCDERAAVAQKTASEQHAFREVAVSKLTALRASTVEKAQRLLDRRSSGPKSSRQRWLERSSPAGLMPTMAVGEDALTWAMEVSRLWHALPEANRQEFQAASCEFCEDKAAVVQQQAQARQLHDLLEEVDVFLANLQAVEGVCLDAAYMLN